MAVVEIILPTLPPYVCLFAVIEMLSFISLLLCWTLCSRCCGLSGLVAGIVGVLDDPAAPRCLWFRISVLLLLVKEFMHLWLLC